MLITGWPNMQLKISRSVIEKVPWKFSTRTWLIAERSRLFQIWGMFAIGFLGVARWSHVRLWKIASLNTRAYWLIRIQSFIIAKASTNSWHVQGSRAYSKEDVQTNLKNCDTLKKLYSCVGLGSSRSDLDRVLRCVSTLRTLSFDNLNDNNKNCLCSCLTIKVLHMSDLILPTTTYIKIHSHKTKFDFPVLRNVN